MNGAAGLASVAARADEASEGAYRRFASYGNGKWFRYVWLDGWLALAGRICGQIRGGREVDLGNGVPHLRLGARGPGKSCHSGWDKSGGTPDGQMMRGKDHDAIPHGVGLDPPSRRSASLLGLARLGRLHGRPVILPSPAGYNQHLPLRRQGDRYSHCHMPQY